MRTRTFSIFLTMVLLFGIVPFDGIVMAAEDTERPIINYAYVEDSILKLSISDNIGLSSKPILYRIDNDYRSHEIHRNDYWYEYDGSRRMGRVYGIDIHIPVSISITIKDLAGNENTYKFSIKEDNAPLTDDVPEFILERLANNRRSIVTRFEGFEDIFELEYGKVVDGFSLYQNIIRDNYYRYNKNDIRIKVKGLSTDKDGNIKLNKYGIFKVTITHKKDKTFEESAYILLKPDWRNAEKREGPSNFNPYIVYKDKIRVSDYFRYEEDSITNKKNSKIDTTYMLVHNEETGETFEMKDRINLDLNKVYKLSVLNFENNSQQDLYIMRQEKPKSKNRNFTDLDNKHWARSYINSLVSKGIISGYPDGRFNPSGNITIREFLTMLSRLIASNPEIGKPVIGDVIVSIKPGSWGYIESKSVLDRISQRDLRRLRNLDMDRPITREEVAFLINKTLILDTAYNTDLSKTITDIWTSPYRTDIRNLIDLDIISGYPDGTFRPKNNITRAEIAALFNRIK